MPERVNALSRHADVCPSCSSLVDGAEEDQADLVYIPPPEASPVAGNPPPGDSERTPELPFPDLPQVRPHAA